MRQHLEGFAAAAGAYHRHALARAAATLYSEAGAVATKARTERERLPAHQQALATIKAAISRRRKELAGLNGA